MKAPMIFMSSTGTPAAPSRRKFLVLLIKDKGAPALVPHSDCYGNPSMRARRVEPCVRFPFWNIWLPGGLTGVFNPSRSK